ncbi:MAG: Bug family tripartite tricarboxylate transporter substrate binding protein, partial [Burkholderiales bacterium]
SISLPVVAQGYASKPVRLIIPAPAGGGMDLVARQLGPRLAEAVGQPIVMENRPGAATIVGVDIAAKAPADGYTLLISSDSAMGVNPLIYKKLPYDTVKDFAPVALVMRVRSALLGSGKSNITSVADLIRLSKEKPGVLNYGSFGVGSSPHLSIELLKFRTQIDIVHVPYKGPPDVLTALTAGELQVGYMGTGGPVRAAVKAGAIRVIAVDGSRKHPLFPAVRTLAEDGLEGIQQAWFAIYAPAGTPDAIVQKLNRDLGSIVKDAAFVQAAENLLGGEPAHSTPAELAALQRLARDSLAPVVQRLNIQLD